MNRRIQIGCILAALLASCGGQPGAPANPPPPTDTPTPAPFLGAWGGVDAFDHSSMTLMIDEAGGITMVDIYDTSGMICGADPYQGRSVSVEIAGNFLHLDEKIWCLNTPPAYYGELDPWTFEYEPSTDTIYEICSTAVKQEFPGACDAKNRSTVFHRLPG